MDYESSLSGLADSLVAETRKIVRQAKTEEELRIGFEKILDPILKSAVRIHSRYKRASAEAKTVFRGRPDAVHGQLIIEYEPPGSFSSKGNVEHAYQQLTDYLSAESRGSKVLCTLIKGDPKYGVRSIL